MISPVIKRSIVLAGHKTSVSLEDAFWKALKEIAIARGTSLSNLVTSIDVERRQGNLSSCLRLFVLDLYRNRVTGNMSTRDQPADAMGMHPNAQVVSGPPPTADIVRRGR
jgi:predicted DNA-binding ribbon-helix-helix protein